MEKPSILSMLKKEKKMDSKASVEDTTVRSRLEALGY
jgi:hypothetical protein